MSQILSLVLAAMLGLVAVAEDETNLPWPPPPGAKRTFLGFRLSQVDAGSIYEKAGLRVGDLVKSLNGKPVVQPDDLKELPVILERDKVVVVKIERDGKVMTLRYRRFKKH